MSIDFVDPRGERLKARRKALTGTETIAELSEQLTILQALIDAEQEGVKHYESAEWKWLTEMFLPARNLEICGALADSSPDAHTENAMIRGQRNENLLLTEMLHSARRLLDTHMVDAKNIQAAIDKYHQENKKNAAS
jgi:hypothetical protein